MESPKVMRSLIGSARYEAGTSAFLPIPTEPPPAGSISTDGKKPFRTPSISIVLMADSAAGFQ